MEEIKKEEESKKLGNTKFLQIVGSLFILLFLLFIAYVYIKYSKLEVSPEQIKKERNIKIENFKNISNKIDTLRLTAKAKKLNITKFYNKNKKLIKNIYVTVPSKNKYYIHKKKDIYIKKGKHLIAIVTKKETLYLYKKQFLIKDKK